MKNLKKFAALLLVGAMALLMLTACGGGGGGSAEKTEEQKVMEKIGSQKNVHVTSDAELRAIAEAHLRISRSSGSWATMHSWAASM